MRTSVPSRLMSSAVLFRQTRVTLGPAIKSFLARSEPYEAPRIKMLRAILCLSRIIPDTSMPELPARYLLQMAGHYNHTTGPQFRPLRVLSFPALGGTPTPSLCASPVTTTGLSTAKMGLLRQTSVTLRKNAPSFREGGLH